MAGLADIVRQGVALADSLTQTLQPTVLHEAWIGDAGDGTPIFAPAQTRAAIIERRQRMIRNARGEEVRTAHTISILRPVSANGAPGRDEPIDARDRFTIPDGSFGPILAVESFTDKDTSSGYFHVVYLGERQ